MSPENQKLNITPRPEKKFRDKKEEIIDMELRFSEVLKNDNPHIYAANKLEMLTTDGNIIGNIYFDITNKVIKIKSVSTIEQFRGQGIGIKLYKEIIRLAQEKGLSRIYSDSVVQGGAIAIWIKLEQEGYSVKNNPKISREFEEFKRIYNDNTYFKNMLKVSEDEHVFELFLDDNEL